MLTHGTELLPTEADTGIIPSPSKPAGLPREEIQQSGVEHAQEGRTTFAHTSQLLMARIDRTTTRASRASVQPGA